MSITVTPRVEKEIREWIETGHYADADMVIQEALQALRDREEAKFLKTQELILAGRDSGIAGELTDEMWERIERSADERLERGDPISPHVAP